MVTLFMLIDSFTSFRVKADDLYDILEKIAEEIISIDTVMDNGGEVTVYENLNQFVNSVRIEYPDISDYQIAEFIVSYTNQEISLENEDNVQFVLGLDNIHTTVEIIDLEDGNVQESVPAGIFSPDDTWISNDNKMKITTSYSYQFNNSNGDYYLVWSTANWITIPTVWEDVFVIGSNATFDSTYNESGNVTIKDKCDETSCGATSTFISSVNANSTTNGNTQLQYASGYPYLRFSEGGHICTTCLSENVHRTKFSVYYQYRVIANGTKMLYPVYAHKKLALSSLSVGISLDGTPSIGGSLGVLFKKYEARGVTLTH